MSEYGTSMQLEKLSFLKLNFENVAIQGCGASRLFLGRELLSKSTAPLLILDLGKSLHLENYYIQDFIFRQLNNDFLNFV